MPASFLKPSTAWLLIFVPAAFVVRLVPALQNDVLIFAFAGLAIVPLASWMGKATEHLASRLGQGVGGLLNATFGNAAELIIALLALSRGLIGVVKASVTGSIIGNLLLVLGLALTAGGLKFDTQNFNRTAVRAGTTTLLLAAIALFAPTVFHVAAKQHPGGWTPQLEEKLSLGIAIILFLSYGAMLIFSLRTHKQLYHGGEEEELHGETWSQRKSLLVLFIATILTAILAEFLVGSIENARKALGLTETFVGIIVVAIVGNAAEHATAVVVARKNKMDLSMSIAIGSSIQVALFVAPVLVFASYFFGKPIDLEFTLPELFAVIASVYIIAQISGDGESNWLEGVQLLAVYLIMGVLFFFLPDPAGGH